MNPVSVANAALETIFGRMAPLRNETAAVGRVTEPGSHPRHDHFATE
jgi:hypothetical protein